MQLFRPLAEQGDVVAQYNLGFMCDEGQGVPQDYAEAAKWFRIAAKQGDTRAQLSSSSQIRRRRFFAVDDPR